MEKVKCAVLGATGVVGQHFLKSLVDHPYFELVAVCASEGRVGQKLGDAKSLVPDGIPTCFSDIVFDSMDMDLLVTKGVQVAFSALPADIAKDLEKKAAFNGIKVFSNAGTYRMDAHVPILIPEINAPHLDLVKEQQKESDGFIVTNANCTTTGLTMALVPILPLKIKKMVVASYQAISGSGYPGHSALDMFTNVIPFISNEEPKLRRECVKICGDFTNNSINSADWEIHAHCLRVATVIGHMISVHVELEQDTTIEQVTQLFKNFKSPEVIKDLPTAPKKPVLFTDDPLRPQPRLDVDAGDTARSKGMAVTVGRLEVEKNIVRFVTLSNNLVRGAAGGSILNAELAYQKGLL